MKKIYLGNIEGIEKEAVRALLAERDWELLREVPAEEAGSKEAVRGEAGRKSASVLDGRLDLQMEHAAFRLEREAERTLLTYGSAAGFFRGLGEFLLGSRAAEKAGCAGRHGVMFDCSRNGVLRVETVKERIRQMALLGYSRLFLYTEDTYEVEGYPYFGALRGRYKKEEIKECDAYAAMFGIEMIPCVQTLAHLRTMLRWPAMMEYRDDEDILIAEEEKTYRLIDAMLKSLSEMYTSRRIHLGMDEAFYLGYGNYRKKNGVPEQGALIKRHLDRVMEICGKYGLEPMIWSDMFFVGAGGGDYYNVPEDYEWPMDERPDRSVTLVYWDYESHERERYARMARLHKKLTDKVCFAGAAWIWNGLAPNYAKAVDAAKAAFAGIKEAGVEDTFLTLWLDNGAETPAAAGLPMIAAYSAYMYGEEPDGERMEKVMRMICGESWEDLLLLSRFDNIPGTGEHNEKFANPSKTIFYQDPLVGIFDRQFEDMDLPEYYARLAERLGDAGERAGKMKGLYRYYRLLALADASKSTLGTRIRNAYLEGDRETLGKIASEELPELIRVVNELKQERENLWFQEYRPNGFEVLDIRISGVAARLASAKKRIGSWLDGRVERIEELEEERLFYLPGEAGERLVPSCNLWENIVSAGNIKGV